MKSNLLLTRIILPSRRSDVLRRPRLLDFLHEFIDRRLLLISAAAGYGKTSLLVDFANDTELPVCWYSLDPGDGDPRVFLEYLVAAIQRQFPRFGGHTTAVLQNPENARNLDECVGALIMDIHEQVETFFVIILDDFHLIENSERVNQLIDRLLLYMPDNAHLIISSRTVPAQLTLTRLTARQQVAGLGTDDLRFTADEIQALVQHNYGLEMTPEVAAELAAQSEGWIAGLVLTTPTLWRGLFREWVKGYGPGNQLFEYLAAEVLSQQSAELQQFLLDTSILPHLEVAWCNELLRSFSAKTLLGCAEKRNLFLTRVEDVGYRYHHLFREFLEARLQQTQPARFKELQQQAAAIFERHGNLDQAVGYRLAAGDPAGAARLLEVFANEYYDLGRWVTLRRWLDALPADALRERPVLLLLSAILTADAGELDEARQLFDEALAEFGCRHDLGHLARALIEMARSEPEPARIIERSHQALKLFDENEFGLQAQAHHAMGIALGHHGDFAEAIPLLQRASTLYGLAGDRALQLEAENALGSLYLWTGPRTLADRHLANALESAQRLGHAAKIANALNSLAVSCYQQGQLSRAAELLPEALDQANKSGSLRIKAYVLATLGDLHRDRGQLAEALEAYTEAAELAERIREEFLIVFARVAVGELWCAGGELSTAERVLGSALQAATAHRSDYEVGLAQMALGALRLEQGELEGAARHLHNALPLLERTHAQRELGRAHFYLAMAAFRRKQPMEAIRQLRAVWRLGRALDEDQFLISAAGRARELLIFAVKRRVGKAYFTRLLEKLSPPSAQPPAAVALAQERWSPLDIYTLGVARVVNDGQVTTWPTTTSKELFFFFANYRQGLRKEQVFEHLWPQASTSQANDLFHSSVYRLRRTLFPECLIFHNGIYELNPEVVRSIDANEFERQLEAAGQATGPREKIELLQRAIELYRGPFLNEFYSDWCVPRREQLHGQFINALAQLARACVALGKPDLGIEAYQKLLSHDPLHEATYRALIELYVAIGNRAAALHAYKECVSRLASELGVPPMPETVAFYERLLLEKHFQ